MGIGVTELLVILVVIFIIFGAGKLPSVMADLGKGMKAFKNASEGSEEAAIPVKKKPRKKAK
ncbi:MAG: twin-arginine translocase TatA/TatE family subunit [Proteobacteria bacterium]|nr:twin-arginine translocase TatA/TatE family subunit [Pseudomonadota bacterium]NBX86641.1 twin-arginine translocase TatA/TatE family subunit [Pseudomonadota bacterium]